MLRKIFTKVPSYGISGVFKSGLTRRKGTAALLKEELLSNPEFDTAFPHLKEHKPSTALPRDKKELDFIRSLFYRWRTTGKVDPDDITKANVSKGAKLRLKCSLKDSTTQMALSKLSRLNKKRKFIFWLRLDLRNSRKQGRRLLDLTQTLG